jgi:hypothetical protein
VIGDAIYTIKVFKNEDFRILDKQPIDNDMKEWIDEND